MSVDLAVWFATGPVTDREAARTYDRLCGVTADEPPAHPRVVAFHRDLTERYPETDDSPWAAGLSTTPTSVVLAISRPRAAEVVPVVRDLAARHGLVCHDPQSGVTHRPGPATGPADGPVLSSCDGSRSADPTPEDIARAVRRLSPANWFAVLERAEQRYVQVGYGEQAGTRPGWYALERRDGSADEHYGTTVTDVGEVIGAVQAYARGDGSWIRRFAWNRVELAPDADESR